MKKRIYTILELDGNYIEQFTQYWDIKKAKKHFMKYLTDSGLGIKKRREAMKEEFFTEGEKQIQLVKAEVFE